LGVLAAVSARWQSANSSQSAKFPNSYIGNLTGKVQASGEFSHQSSIHSLAIEAKSLARGLL